MKRFFLFVLLFIKIHLVFGQEMFGIVNSNYAGSIGITLNPASAVGMPFRHEFNLHAEGLSFQNNYMYFPAGNDLIQIINGSAVKEEGNIAYYNTSANKTMYGNAFILGPSYAMSKRNSGWAIHTAIRMNVNIDQLNSPLAKFMWDGLNFDPQQDLELKTNPYSFNMVQWYEAGFTYGRKLLESKKNLITLGATLNFDLGSNAIYIKSEPMNINVPSPDRIEINNFTGIYAHTFDSDHPEVSDFTGIKGIGGGLNLGVQYYRLRDEKVDVKIQGNCRKYLFKVGVSLIDMGYINFFNDNEVYEFKNNKAVWTEIDTIKFKGINDFEEYLNTKFTGSPEGAVTNKKLTMGLPTAASIQFDFNIYRNFFANISCIQRIRFYDPEVSRANQLSISASYQTGIFEVAIPYSLNQYYQNQVGFMIRYKFFFIGTDEIGSYLGTTNIDGLNAYFGIKFTRGCIKKAQSDTNKK